MERIKTFPIKLTEVTHQKMKDAAYKRRMSLHAFIVAAAEEKTREIEAEIEDWEKNS